MITVLSTTYNCAPYIGQAIKSILIQTYKEFEFLIIDDGSTDDTEKIVDTFSDKRIRYIKRNHFGRSSALNFGLKNSSNEIIALMDADDISHPQRLELQLKKYSNNINEIVFTTAAYFKNKRIVFEGKKFNSHEQFCKQLALHGPYNNATALFNRNQLLDNDGYNEVMQFSEDHELWLRLKDISVFIQMPEILYFIRLRNSSLSDNNFSENKQITYNLLKDYYKDLPQHFKFTSDSEVERLRGWREYFYGTKNNCRKEWLALKLKFWNCKILLASLISFLPERIFHLIKKNRVRLRMQFWISRIKNKNTIQKKFDSVLNSLKG